MKIHIFNRINSNSTENQRTVTNAAHEAAENGEKCFRLLLSLQILYGSMLALNGNTKDPVSWNTLIY